MEKNIGCTIAEIQELTERIAGERIAPTAGDRDRDGSFPRKAIELLGASGLLGMILTEEHQGVGANRAAFAAMTAELGGACASTALVAVSHLVAAKAIETAATAGVRETWLSRLATGRALGAVAVHEPGSGSNAAAIATTAARDGGSYLVNGSKFFITSAGEADVYLVLVRTDPEKGPQGMSVLLLEKNTPGLSFGRPEEKMGLRGSSSRQMFFENCRVPVENRIGSEGGGLQVIGGNLVGWGFFGAAGLSLGLARQACRLAVDHARERKIAGQPIGAQQAVQTLLADMLLRTEAAEALLASCAHRADDHPEAAGINGVKAKLFASETAVAVTDKAIQVMGGHGYSRDYTVERLFRDARGLLLHFKTSELLRQDVAKAALGI